MQEDIALELNRYCDKACKHCGTRATLSKKYDETSMSLDTIVEILNQVEWMNKNRHMKKIVKVHLTGGEPFMWQSNGDRIGDAVKAIQERGFEPQILTSSTCPTDRGHKRYRAGINSIMGIPFFNVYHSFNLYMAGASITSRLKFTIPLVDEALDKNREIGFFGVYDKLNRSATLKEFNKLMAELSFRPNKAKGTRNWREESRKGELIELVYANGKRAAEAEFSSVDNCAGRARTFNLEPLMVGRECYILDDEGIQPVIGYSGDVYPCWAGPYPDTRPIGNIHKDHLATILSREEAYLKAFKDCIKVDHDKRTDICRFCVDVSKDCLDYQFR